MQIRIKSVDETLKKNVEQRHLQDGRDKISKKRKKLVTYDLQAFFWKVDKQVIPKGRNNGAVVGSTGDDQKEGRNMSVIDIRVVMFSFLYYSFLFLNVIFRLPRCYDKVYVVKS